MLQELQESSSSFLVATFFIGETQWGIDTLRVQEIIRVVNVTPVRNAPGYISGIINLRGKIVTVIDLGRKLELSDSEPGQDSRIIIVDWSDEHIGLLVDRVADVVPADKPQIAPAPSNVKGVQASFLEGVLRTQEKLIAILEIDKILSLNKS